MPAMYDPVRDCQEHAPAAATGTSQPWRDASVVAPGSSGSSNPPFWADEPAPSVSRPPSSGLRALLNDEPEPVRSTRDSRSRTSISSLTASPWAHDSSLPPTSRPSSSHPFAFQPPPLLSPPAVGPVTPRQSASPPGAAAGEVSDLPRPKHSAQSRQRQPKGQKASPTHGGAPLLQPEVPRKFSYQPKRAPRLTLYTTADEYRGIHAWMGYWNNPLKWKNTRPPLLPAVAWQLADVYSNTFTTPETRRAYLQERWPDLQESLSYGQSSTGAQQRQAVDYTGTAGHVADHYNSRPEVGLQNRELSPIIGLKKFNNWIKSVLIGKFAHRERGRPGACVLDIGCGKGGDLNKWKQARIRLYVGLDIAQTSTEQAAERYAKMNRPSFDAFFFAHDCYSRSIKEVLPDDLAVKDLYDNVTMQFCMHYAFESASKVRMMMENVSRYLRPGGIFIGTIPDSQLLLNRLDEIPADQDELRFGNSCYFVEFTQRDSPGMYGHQYRFYLEDAVGDVPEYIVDWDNFMTLAAEYNFELIYKKGFAQVLEEEQSSRDFGPLLTKMGVVNSAGESAMDADQWEAANLYMAFAFVKK